MGRSRRAGYDDLLKLPDHVVGEIIGGSLYASPRPSPQHANAASVIGADLGSPFHRGRGGPGGWWILDEPELHFGEDVLVPDIAGWRRERMPALPNTAAFELAPDWICEIVSPRTTKIDRVDKPKVYARIGVAHMWIVDPLAATLEVFKLSPDGYTLIGAHGGTDRVRAVPFDAVELDLTGWWAELPTPP